MSSPRVFIDRRASSRTTTHRAPLDALPTIEQKRFRAQLRAIDGANPRITGHAAVFNSLSEPLGWEGIRERIVPGAFMNTIAANDDVRALMNHDSNFVLGRTKSLTLTLAEDSVGLAVVIYPPDTQTIRDLVIEPMKRGDVDQMSFGFEIVRQSWGVLNGEDVREIQEVKLFDVSVVTFPAYPATDAQVRARSGERQRSAAQWRARLVHHEWRARLSRHGV